MTARRPIPSARPRPCWPASPAPPSRARVALGPRAGARVRRVGDEPALYHVSSRGPRPAQLDGFDLHAGVGVPARDRAGLERLCRLCGAPHTVGTCFAPRWSSLSESQALGEGHGGILAAVDQEKRGRDPAEPALGREVVEQPAGGRRQLGHEPVDSAGVAG